MRAVRIVLSLVLLCLVLCSCQTLSSSQTPTSCQPLASEVQGPQVGMCPADCQCGMKTQSSSEPEVAPDFSLQVIDMESSVASSESEVATATDSVPEPVSAIAPESENESEEIMQASETVCPWDVGDEGPNGGLVFCCNGKWLEMLEPVYEVESYQEAIAYCDNCSVELGRKVRLPSVPELLAIYGQLVEAELCDIDWTYYWSCESIDDTSAKIVNFDTGFEGSFYKSLNFISAIPVAEL